MHGVRLGGAFHPAKKTLKTRIYVIRNPATFSLIHNFSTYSELSAVGNYDSLVAESTLVCSVEGLFPELLRARETRVQIVEPFSRGLNQARPDGRRQQWYPPQTVDERTR
jgi:hypothetical protein